MDTPTITGFTCAVAGAAFVLVALLGTSLPRHKRWICGYGAFCFFVFGGLEYFHIIHLESWH